MRRRSLLAVLAGVALWPLAGYAQQPERMRRVGVLMPWPETEPLAQASVAAIKQELGRLGWVEGTNIRIDYRFARDDPSLIKEYAAELVEISPDAILASTNPTIAALQRQTHTIPIVFALVADPVGFGFVQSFARPGGNITGFNSYPEPMAGKWLQLLKEVAPGIARVAVVYSGDVTRFAAFFNQMIEAAAPSFGLTVVQAPVYDDVGIEETLAAFARELGGSLIALPNSFNTAHGSVIVAAALRHGLPLLGTPDFPRPVPSASNVAFLAMTGSLGSQLQVFQEASRRLQMSLILMQIAESTPSEYRQVFAEIAREGGRTRSWCMPGANFCAPGS